MPITEGGYHAIPNIQIGCNELITTALTGSFSQSVNLLFPVNLAPYRMYKLAELSQQMAKYSSLIIRGACCDMIPVFSMETIQ